MTKNKTVTAEEWYNAKKLNEELKKEYAELVEKTKYLHYLIMNVHMDILPEEEYKKSKELFEPKEQNINNNNNIINRLKLYYKKNLLNEETIVNNIRSDKLFMYINLIKNNINTQFINTFESIINSIEDIK